MSSTLGELAANPIRSAMRGSVAAYFIVSDVHAFVRALAFGGERRWGERLAPSTERRAASVADSIVDFCTVKGRIYRDRLDAAQAAYTLGGIDALLDLLGVPAELPL